MPITTYIPLELKLISAELRDRIISDVLSKPTAYVEFIDESDNSYILSACTAFSVTHSLDSITEGFSCTLDLANIWNPRTIDYQDLFSFDLKKRVNIYYGQWIDGEIHYVKIFTGIPTNKPESYAHAQSNQITLSGSSLAYLLSITDGSFSTANYSGNSKQLIEYWIAQSGLDLYQLTYTDTITYNDRPIAYQSALTGVHAVRNVLGPLTDTYVTPDGVYVMRDTPELIPDTAEFSYDDSNILSLSLSEDVENITTVAVVTGDSESSSVTKEASAAMLEKYGENILTRNNGLITTATQADTLAQDMLDYGALHQNVVDMRVMLNPYILGSSILSIQSDFASLSERIVKVDSVSHSYSHGSDHTTTIKGLFE